MVSEQNSLEYNLFEELEETIEQIYNRADRSDKRIDVLVEGENQFEQDEMRKEYGRIFEDEEKHNFERHQLSQDDPENPFSTSRWVNTELMMLETTLGGMLYPFRQGSEDARVD